MSEEKGFYRNERYRKKSAGPKDTTPFPNLPKGSTISEKTIAYLHVYLGKEPKEIVAAYPSRVTLAEIHLALAHYYQDPTAIDAELKREGELNSRDALNGASLSLPAVGLHALADTFSK